MPLNMLGPDLNSKAVNIEVGFNLEDVIQNTNNKVALLYPEHSNKEVFLCVSDFKCCIREAFTRSPIQYKEYLSEFWYSANALGNSKVSFLIPTGGIYGVLEVYCEEGKVLVKGYDLEAMTSEVTP
ncbi:hypothetical protein Tco_1277092 [Tanacetum coccineum]